MSATYISAALRRLVEERAKNRCEYCLIHVDDVYYAHHVDHVIAEKHGGQTNASNLALSCAECNLRKGSDIASLTSTGRLIALFNPRRQRWSAHLRVDGGTIEPPTPVGEVTARLLDFNNETRVEIRDILVQLKLYPRR